MAGKGVLDSFVARIWLERKRTGDPVWRGHIRHIQGRENTYFRDFAGMSDFLTQVSGVPGPGANHGIFGLPPENWSSPDVRIGLA